MQSIGDLLKSQEVQQSFFPKTDREKRNEAINELWVLYTSEKELRFRKISNWRLYCRWIKTNKFENNVYHQERFRKSSWFIKPQTLKSMCIRLSHLKTSRDVYYVLSVCRDRHNRGQSIGSYIWGATKVKGDDLSSL